MDLVRFLILNVVNVLSEKLTPSSSTPNEQEKRFNKRIIFIRLRDGCRIPVHMSRTPASWQVRMTKFWDLSERNAGCLDPIGA